MVTAAERIAKTFVDTRAALGASLGYDLEDWTSMSEFGKTAHIRVFEVMLEHRQITPPERVTQSDVFSNPDEVARDVREIDALIAGLGGMYARAHDDVLSASGSGEVSGVRGGGGGNPTLEQTIHGIDEEKSRGWDPKGGRAKARDVVRKDATRIREARNLLYMARGSLLDFTTSTMQQPSTKDVKALVEAADFVIQRLRQIGLGERDHAIHYVAKDAAKEDKWRVLVKCECGEFEIEGRDKDKLEASIRRHLFEAARRNAQERAS